MTFLERLKEIIPINITISNSFNVNLVENPSTEKYIPSPNNNEIDFNYTALTMEEKEKVDKLIKEQFGDKKIYVMENKANERVKDIKTTLTSKEIKEILDFYKDKILEKHYNALESSLYMLKIFESGGSVSELKKDIVNKFGEEGRNIANLCTSKAGYFEGYIKDLYGEMRCFPNFTDDDFKKEFQKIVNIMPFTVFVHRDMIGNEIRKEVYNKIDTHKKYGIKFLDIHGIGRENIEQIRKIVDQLKKERTTLNIDIRQYGNVIYVRIYIN